MPPPLSPIHILPESSLLLTNPAHPDYLQHLSDDNKVRVEKIGSGNWYWSFPSEAAKTAQTTLETARTAHAAQAAVVADLKAKLAGSRAAEQAESDELGACTGESREDLLAAQAELAGAMIGLEKQLAAYKENDPTELERVGRETSELRELVERVTDDVYAMEGWFREQGQDQEGMLRLKMDLYEGEFDEEEGCLREIS